MKTKPIDYTGCHPQIAAALKRGEMIECWLDREKKLKGYVYAYIKNATWKYKCEGNSLSTGWAEPVE